MGPIAETYRYIVRSAGVRSGNPIVEGTRIAVHDVNIENLFSPQSLVSNSIGFDTLLAGYVNNGLMPPQTFANDYTLTGSMSVGLTNVFIQLPLGIWLPLTRADASTVGKINTSGDSVNIKYSIQIP